MGVDTATPMRCSKKQSPLLLLSTCEAAWNPRPWDRDAGYRWHYKRLLGLAQIGKMAYSRVNVSKASYKININTVMICAENKFSLNVVGNK